MAAGRVGRGLHRGDRLSAGRGKGFALLGLIALVRERYGPPVLEAWLHTIEAQWRDQITHNLLLAPSWVPLELYFGLLKHAVRGSEEEARTLGHDTAARAIGTFYKAVLQFTSPALVIAVSGRFWSSYFDVGRLAVVSNAKGRVGLEVQQWPLTDLLVANELGGSFLAWVERSRGADVMLEKIDAVEPSTLRYQISWR